LGALEATYDDYLQVIGKRVYQFEIGDFAPARTSWYKLAGSRGRPPPTILLLRKN